MSNRRVVLLPLFFLSLLISFGANASPLRIGVVEGAKFGYRYDGVDADREAASFEFPRQSTDLVLFYTVFDIDAPLEVSIEVNDRFIGYAVQTGNNLSKDWVIVIPADRMVDGENSLVFRNRLSGAVWGVTDLRLDRSSIQTSVGSLALDVTDDSRYGYAYGDQYDHREGMTFTFQGASEDLTLYYEAYDIESGTEVSVELNGTIVGHLSATGDRESLDDFLVLPASNLRSDRNSLVFRQRRPGNAWGVSGLLLTHNWCA